MQIEPALRDLDRVTTSVWLGDLHITPAYSGLPGMVGLYRRSGEGGDFPLDKLIGVLEKFYEEHF